MILLRVSGISKQLQGSIVVKEVSFTQKKLQKISITGETGSGKSTLLKMIAGWVQPDAGEIIFNDTRVQGPDEKLIPGHAGIAYLSQDHELRNNYRMEELLQYANKLTHAEAATLYKICRIDHLLKRKNNQLSGGEKQRMALARLLVGSPKLLLLDEPFSNLDLIHKNILKSVIEDIGERLEVTCMLTSHDPMDTLSWADEIIVMKEGLIVQKGSPGSIYYHPETAYTAGLFGSYNLLSSLQAKKFGLAGKDITSFFIRPENFIFVPDENTGLKGMVKKIVFRGGYYEVSVQVADADIIIKTLHCRFVKGDIVYISLLFS